MEQSNARAWGRTAGERAGVAASAVVRCALRAVAVNVVAVVAAPFLAACSDPAGSVGPVPSAARLSAVPAVGRPGDAIPDEYIITFSDDAEAPEELSRRLTSQHGGKLRFTYSAALKGFAAQLPPQAVDALRRNPLVRSVEPDTRMVATDVQRPAPWNLDRIDQRVLPLSGDYTYESAGAGVSVYIIDSGIRATHAEFGGRASGAFTAINDGRGTNDCTSHGTHVAGTVGGARYGVAKGVTLVAVRVLDCSGSGPTSGVIAGVDWVTRNRRLPAVATMSMSGTQSASLNLAVQNSISSGVVYAVAAGNSAADACTFSPASTREALTVGASSNSDGVSGYSNVGPCVDIFAPGDAIRSAYSVDDTSTVYKGGTSMAAPHVAGAAALLLSANPTATPTQVADAIISGASGGVLKNATSGSPNRVLYSGLSAVTPGPVAPAPAPIDTAEPPALSPASPDLPPVPRFTSKCGGGVCTFDAAASSDDRGIVSYSWRFGDGSAVAGTAASAKVSHAYRVAGKYSVTLTVADAGGQQGTATNGVQVKRF
jgi:subtilisin family serine protease